MIEKKKTRQLRSLKNHTHNLNLVISFPVFFVAFL